MNPKAEFAVRLLKEYAYEKETLPRSTLDISPLEEWLILKLYWYSQMMAEDLKDKSSNIEA